MSSSMFLGRGQRAGARHLVAGLVAAGALSTAGVAEAQLDTQHWIPPAWAATTAANRASCLFLSTPSTSPVHTTVYDGAGLVIWSGNVSNAAPIAVGLVGNCHGTAVTRNGPSALGNILVDNAALNAVSNNGVRIVADQPVYANIRNSEDSQQDIASSKGRQGLGTEFRVGIMRSINGTAAYRGAFVSVMATQDNTTVTFDQFHPGFFVYGLPKSGSPATTNPKSIVLQAGQSYVIGVKEGTLGSHTINDFNGTRVSATSPIVVLSGNYLGGATSTTAQDIGIDEEVPVTLAATEYVIVKGLGGSTLLESPMVVAVEDNTNVYVNGGSTPVSTANCHSPLPAGGYCFLDGQWSGNTMLVRTSVPALMYQSLAGSTSAATPGFIAVPPIAGSLTTEVNNIPDVKYYNTTANLNIITRAGSVVKINGQTVGSPLSVTGTPDWVAYRVSSFPSGGALSGNLNIQSTGSVAVGLVNINAPVGGAGYFSGFPPAVVDLDNDGIPDGSDNCPDVPNADQADSDGDGVGDACDQCPSDPGKSVPGACGCGVGDGDPDGDGVTCTDNCPNTPNPTQTDINNDGIGDACQSDQDGDGVPDIADGCPNDTHKSMPGYCGCGLPETDSDLDGLPNCIDGCPIDANKTDPGLCGCGQAESCDGDGDQIPDGSDNCPTVTNADQLDTDNDGIGDACECLNPCPAATQCEQAGTCDPTTGNCSYPPVADGTACDDGDLCTQTDTCVAGACAGSNPVVCTTPNQCQAAGTCDPLTGQCSSPIAVGDGTACDDGHDCTVGETCEAGACGGGAIVTTGACTPVCMSIQRTGAALDSYDSTISTGTKADKNWGLSNSLATGTIAPDERYGMLWFDLSALPQSGYVTSATVTLNVYANGGQPVRAHAVTAPWDEAAVTWNVLGGQGGYDPLVAGTFPGVSATVAPVPGLDPALTSADITALAQDWAEGVLPNYGLLLEEDPTGRTSFCSSDWAYNIALRPKLDICFIPNF